MFFILNLCVLKVVDEYNRREQEIKHLEKELEDKSNALNAYRQNISEVHGYFTAVVPPGFVLWFSLSLVI